MTSDPVRSPLPVLFVDHAEALGGAERALLSVIERMDRTRWRPHLACDGGPLAEAAASAGATVHRVPMERLRRSPRWLADGVYGIRALVRLAGEVNAHVLYANTIRAACYTAPAARLARRPFVWHVQDFWLSESKPRWTLVDRLGKVLLCAAATRVVTCSHAVARHLRCTGKASVIHNGIDVDTFDEGLVGSGFRSIHGIPEGEPLVGTVGRLRPWKGQHRFLQMAAQVLVEEERVHFVIVGGDPFGVGDGYEASLHAVVEEWGLGASVTFTGHLDDVRPALAAMDVFVHPGDPEPFGLVNVEAMAMATPVVGFAHGALPEIVVDGETGRLVEPGDSHALARTVRNLLHDPERRARWGRRGRARVARHFTAARMTRDLEEVLVNVSA